jgi:hypothetical protein
MNSEMSSVDPGVVARILPRDEKPSSKSKPKKSSAKSGNDDGSRESSLNLGDWFSS